MQHFFADRSWVQGDKIRLEGSDVNHMKNVLRMKEGEEVQVSDGTGNAYLCQIEGYEGDQAVLKIREKTEKDTELPSKIWLFQGLPKGDKMELIVQKAVELGVYGIVPFAAKRSVVRLDEKKAGKKQIPTDCPGLIASIMLIVAFMPSSSSYGTRITSNSFANSSASA